MYSIIENEIGIREDDFNAAVFGSDEGNHKIKECLLRCIDEVSELEGIAFKMLMYIVSKEQGICDELDMMSRIESIITNEDGGPGSGNFGHKGVPGQVGGSAPAYDNGELTQSMRDARIGIIIRTPTPEQAKQVFGDSSSKVIGLINEYSDKVNAAKSSGDKETAEKLQKEWMDKHNAIFKEGLEELGTYMEEGYYVSEKDISNPLANIWARDMVDTTYGCYDMRPLESCNSRDNVAAVHLANNYVKLSDDEVKSRSVLSATMQGSDVTIGGISSSEEKTISQYTYATPANSALRKGETNEQADKLER